MNLIDESVSYEKKHKQDKISLIIIISIVVLLVAIIGVFIAIIGIKNSELKLYLDGTLNGDVKELIVEEDGTMYLPIKNVAKYLGYEAYNGDYMNKSEESSKCYIQNEDEVANFALNSNKIYKLETSNSSSGYELYYAKNPVKAKEGVLYASVDAIEKAFNISFSYDENKNTIKIYTMPYLIASYTTKVLDYGYDEITDIYVNKKAVLNNMLIVKKGEKFAVINVDGSSLIEAKYDSIEYLPNSGDFLVSYNSKYGIISSKKETKVQLLYDDLKLIDVDEGLYLAKKSGKYGVIDSKGSIIIHIEYNKIGIDSSKFENNDIKNGYILDNGMIPVLKDKLWGAFDKKGRQVLELKYDSFGYIATGSSSTYNLLMIPDYNVLVAEVSGKYTLINSSGKELCNPVLDDVYMNVESGKKYYYMNFSDKTANVIEFLDQIGVKVNTEQNEDSSDITNSIRTGNEIAED